MIGFGNAYMLTSRLLTECRYNVGGGSLKKPVDITIGGANGVEEGLRRRMPTPERLQLGR